MAGIPILFMLYGLRSLAGFMVLFTLCYTIIYAALAFAVEMLMLRGNIKAVVKSSTGVASVVSVLVALPWLLLYVVLYPGIFQPHV